MMEKKSKSLLQAHDAITFSVLGKFRIYKSPNFGETGFMPLCRTRISKNDVVEVLILVNNL